MTNFQEACNDLVRFKKDWVIMPNDVGGTGSRNAGTGFIGRTGNKRNDKHPCHAFIRYYTDAEYLWSVFVYKTSEEVALAFHNWLCLKSPWVKIGIVPDLPSDWMFRQGFVFKDLDKTPANVLHNFLVGSRMATEWPNWIKAWYSLVGSGINHDLAFVMLTCFLPVNENAGSGLMSPLCEGAENSLTKVDKYDWPLDMARADEQYVLNFLNGNPVGASKQMFWPDAQTKPVNTLWGPLTDDLNSKAIYVNVLRELYLKDFGTKRTTPIPKSGFVVTNRGSQPDTEELIFTPDAVRKIMKLEEIRLIKRRKST